VTPKVRLSVIGGGAWGVALARAGQHAGSDVLLYARRAGDEASAGIARTRSLAEAASFAHLVLLAVPSGAIAEVARELGAHVDGRHLLVHGVRGLVDGVTGPRERPTLRTISDLLREVTPARRIGALGGPVKPDELAAHAPSVMVVGSRFPEVSEQVRRALGTSALRIYSTEDLTGLEWASALTAMLAIAVGFARGAGLGAGVVAAFVTRGIHEAARVAAAAGAEERTFFGLGGFGDLLAAIATFDDRSDARPEIRFGAAIARGASVETALREVGERLEAIELAPRVAAFAKEHRVAAPICEAIAHALAGQTPMAELIARLMVGPLQAHA
jgi:glycerol-3-phosphate dehydrogenase (NAD(P)+)